VFWKAVPTLDVAYSVSLISLHFMYDIPLLSKVCNNSSFSHTTGPPYIHHPYSPSHSENLQLILIYLTKWSIFSFKQSNAVSVDLTNSFIIFQ